MCGLMAGVPQLQPRKRVDQRRLLPHTLLRPQAEGKKETNESNNNRPRAQRNPEHHKLGQKYWLAVIKIHYEKLRKRNKAIIAYNHTLLIAVTKASKQGQMCTAATNIRVAHIEYDKNNICGLKCSTRFGHRVFALM